MTIQQQIDVLEQEVKRYYGPITYEHRFEKKIITILRNMAEASK